MNWLPAQDTCDLDKVRLTHLDGSALTPDEYDRLQRFIRLWHKLDWTMPETDLALIGTSSTAAYAGKPGGATGSGAPGTPGGTQGRPTAGAGNGVGFEMFQPECPDGDDSDEEGCGKPPAYDPYNCPDKPKVAENISTEFLHQLVAIRKLLDLTGLPLDKLLSFWADINVAGTKPLYARLFLTHNLLGIDKIFKSNTNGNYLTQGAKMSAHMPVLLAALKLKSDDVAAIVALRSVPDALTLPNVSVLYRHSLLAKLLHVQVADVAEVIALFGDPFRSAQDALALLRDWGSMEDTGFTFSQLNYLIRNHDDPKRPLAPSRKSILQISKTLYDGLNAIDQDHKDVPADNKDEATADAVRAKAGLLFEASVVEQIINLLEGTSVYTTNATPNLVIAILETDSLATKLKYNNQKDATPPNASIQVTGILTDAEKTRAKALASDPGWGTAIDRVGKLARQFFNDNLSGIFPNTTQAIATLLAGDINVPPDPGNPAAPSANTAPVKRYYFLQFFLPFLRQRLAHRLIVGNLSGAAGLATDVTDVLLTDVLLVGAARQHAITALEQIHQKPAATGNDWKGYLIPTVDDLYTFAARSLVGDSQPPAIVLDGQTIPFTVQQEDPSNVWSTDPASPLKLKSGKLYWLEVTGQPATALLCKTSASPKAPISASALLPDFSSTGTEEVFVKLYKAALVVNGFSMTVDEVTYWQAHGPDFAAESTPFDFNAVALGHWRRLQAYTALRDTLPTTDSSLLDLFKWAGKPDDVKKLTDKIAAATLWANDRLQKLMAPAHFDLDHPEAFRNEIKLVQLSNALRVSEAIGADIDRLFGWANPVSQFSVCHHIAEGIRATLRARYDQENWEQVVKPLNDQLREDQKLALISYLLVQQDLIDWGVVDADSLFEFFLIDVQMDACMETSRIKQAISTVQLFVQRCLLGLEADHGVDVGVLSRSRWDWMQGYRVWEANRKVFLYPENWIKSELRDDKTPFFKDLESELLQKDINTQTVEDALRNYLFKVDEIANVKVVALFLDTEGTKLHVFGRTRNAPYFFYYRYFNTAEKNWYPWEKMPVDIPSYDLEELADGILKLSENGVYLAPIVSNKRLLVFFPQITKKTTIGPDANLPIETVTHRDSSGNETGSTTTLPAKKPLELWEVKMAWSEYRNGKWTPKQVSAEAVYTTSQLSINHFRFVPRNFVSAEAQVVIDVYRENAASLGFAFWFTGSQLTKDGVRGGTLALKDATDFQYYHNSHEIHSLQAVRTDAPTIANVEPFFTDKKHSVIFNNDTKTINFFHPFAHELLGTLATGGLDGLFDYYRTKIPDDSPTVPHKIDAFGGDASPVVYHELKRPCAIYNWETAFHAPMRLVDRSSQCQAVRPGVEDVPLRAEPVRKGHECH